MHINRSKNKQIFSSENPQYCEVVIVQSCLVFVENKFIIDICNKYGINKIPYLPFLPMILGKSGFRHHTWRGWLYFISLTISAHISSIDS